MPNHERDETAPSLYLETGLSGAQVAERIARGQVNHTTRSRWRPYRDLVVRNTATLFNALVVPAGIALFLLGDYRSAWAVSIYAILNSLIGLVQEVRAQRHLDKLAILVETKARVLRDGEERMIRIGDIVVGDHIRMAAGDAVVADGTVLSAQYLEVDEALLTGESDPVPRRIGDRLLSGSVCIAGRGSYQADKVGNESFAQQTSAKARRYRYAPSPMQRVLDTLIRVLTATTIVLCMVYVGLHYLRGFPQTDLWQMIAATVTSMVPQGLVLMTTLAFTLGAVRMSARGVAVQRLNAVESMASVDVLCMDKTGTLTTSNLRLDQVRAIDQNEMEVRLRLRLFAWSSIDTGSKTIAALRAALGPLGADAKLELIDQVSFKSQNRYSAVCVRVGDSEQALVLGGVEALSPLLTERGVKQVEAIYRELLPTGLRLLLFAEARHLSASSAFHGSLHGFTLSPLGLVALRDELRPEAPEVLEALAAQGIQLKILSGDNPETVRATIGHLPLDLARDPVISGEHLDVAPDRARVIAAASVFGRVTPRQKLDIITELQAQRHFVAMIGDGINDILPIKQADLGIAMGSGCIATRTVAGLVLENDDFTLIPQTLDEGRTILHNLRRTSKLFLLKNVYTLFLIAIGFGLFGREFPYLPQQVTLLNALTIGGPAFLLMLSRSRTSRPVRTGFLREVGVFAMVAGLSMGIAGLAVWLLSASWGDDQQTRRTFLLTTLILMGLGNMLLVAEREVWLFCWAAAALPVYAIVMYVKPMAYFFELTALSVSQWNLVGIAAASALIVSATINRRIFTSQYR